MEKPKISVFILSKNEEDKIEQALQSVIWADEIVLIDSFSSDHTVEIARAYGAKIVEMPFERFGSLRQAGIAHTTHSWIFSLDADERCTPEAKHEILQIISNRSSADAYLVPRRNIFMGRPIRYGGWYPDYRQPQLFRRGRLTYRDNDYVHEGYELRGQLEKMHSAIIQIPYRNLAEAIHKMNRYTDLNAIQHREKPRRGGLFRGVSHGLWAFFKSYVLQRGLLDGSAGFMIALLRLENSLYKHLKLSEQKSAVLSESVDSLTSFSHGAKNLMATGKEY